MLGRFLSPDNYVQLPDYTQSFNRYAYAFNNPLKYTDPSGEVVPLIAVGIGVAIAAYALSTETMYEMQKTFSPIAFKLDLPFGTHTNGFGFDISIGTPYSVSPIGYRYNYGITRNFNSIGGYGTSWQIRNGGEWSLGFGTFRYGGTRYRNFTNNWHGIDNQVVHTISIGGRNWRLSYSNDSWGSFPWTKIGSTNGNFFGLPTLMDEGGNVTGWNSDRYRTASGFLRVGNFETGFFLHTGEWNEKKQKDIGLGTWGPRNGNTKPFELVYFAEGNIEDADRSNGIIYMAFGDVKIGWDSEGIRHALQNRLVHDHTIRPYYGNNYPWILRVNRNPRIVFQYGNF